MVSFGSAVGVTPIQAEPIIIFCDEAGIYQKARKVAALVEVRDSVSIHKAILQGRVNATYNLVQTKSPVEVDSLPHQRA